MADRRAPQNVLELVETDHRGVRLTVAGEALVAEARLMLFHAQRAVEGARAAKGQHKRPWGLGYTPLLDRRILAKVRQHLSAAHPSAEIPPASSYTSEQTDALMRGKLQAGLVILPEQKAKSHAADVRSNGG